MWSSISPWAGGLPRRFCCIGGLALAPGLAWQSEARCYALTCLGASWVNPERNASPILNRPEAHVQNDRWAFRSPHRPTIVTTESIRRRTVEESDHRNRLLRPRRERPRHCRAAEQRDEVAALHVYTHSITSSARASSVAGTSMPSALAVVRLMTRSNLVGCSTGMSAGFVPRRILSTNSAARRNR